MANKYYDKKYEDHIIFFDEPQWLTVGEWMHTYPNIVGSYDLKLVNEEVNEDTKLPFVYRAKHTRGDDLYILEKQIKDGTYGFCNSSGVLSLC